MPKTRIFLMCAMVAIAAGQVPAADPPEQPMIAVLKSDAPKAEKAITCKRLAIYGSKDAVPALRDAQNDSDEYVREAATAAIKAIGN